MRIHLWGWIYFPLYFIQVRMQTLLNAYANKETTVLLNWITLTSYVIIIRETWFLAKFYKYYSHNTSIIFYRNCFKENKIMIIILSLKKFKIYNMTINNNNNTKDIQSLKGHGHHLIKIYVPFHKVYNASVMHF